MDYTLLDEHMVRVEDVRARIDELEMALVGDDVLDEEEREALLKTALTHAEYDELLILRELDKEAGEASSEWEHGEPLVKEEFFLQYTKELIQDCYDDIPGKNDNNRWPYNHITIDYESAAEELKQDYTTVGVGGATWYIRG